MKKDCIHCFGDKGCAILKKGTSCTGCKFYENIEISRQKQRKAAQILSEKGLKTILYTDDKGTKRIKAVPI